MATKTKPSARAKAIPAAYAATAKAAEKVAKATRDLLSPGEHRVKLRLTGRVDRYKIDETIAGKLTISADQTTNESHKPDVETLVGRLFAEIPEARRRTLTAELTAEFRRKGKQAHTLEPAKDPEAVADASRLVAALRGSTSKPKRGAVSFAAE